MKSTETNPKYPLSPFAQYKLDAVHHHVEEISIILEEMEENDFPNDILGIKKNKIDLHLQYIDMVNQEDKSVMEQLKQRYREDERKEEAKALFFAVMAIRAKQKSGAKHVDT